MDWKALSWQESLDKYHCWLEKEDMESWERWKKSRLRCCCRPRCAAAGRTLERWRSGACAARCGWGCGTVPASCAAGWTRCAAVPGQEGELGDGVKRTEKGNELAGWKLIKKHKRYLAIINKIAWTCLMCGSTACCVHLSPEKPVDLGFYWLNECIWLNDFSC